VFQDVHPDGAAHALGIRSGARLLAVNGSGVGPPVRPEVRLRGGLDIRFENATGGPTDAAVGPLLNAAGKRPASVFVLSSEVEPGIGHLRVTQFPGLVGIDLAKEIDRAIGHLKHCSRLIIDLRGNPGGGSGNLRLMSYLTPERIPVGYSLTRPRAEKGYRRESLARFKRIPSGKWQLPFLALRFKFVDKSIVVVTEGLGPQPFHGRIAMLVNEHTGSGAEIVAGFAAQHGLATIVGARTMGRLLGWSSLPVGHGYKLTIPVSNYLAWDGTCFEGGGVKPDAEVPFSAAAAWAGRDNQLEVAIDIAKRL
jgi:C-terminal processing protease CtpA/Prc